jgi:hypothetical protein
MKPVHALVLAVLTTILFGAPVWAQTSATAPVFVPAKYCCQMPGVGSVCVVFEGDGTYTASGKLSGKNGTSRGAWKQQGDRLILTPKEASGCLVGYLTRFSIDEHQEGMLTWLPKKPQNFAHGGGAVVYPRYVRAGAKVK